MLSRNVETHFKSVKIGGWRKSALSTWKLSKDCSIYCPSTINAEPALNFIKEYNDFHDHKITITHLAVRACAKMVEENPEINRLLRGRKLYQRKEINISILAANPKDPQNLSNIRFFNADKLSMDAIADKAHRENKDVKSGKDSNMRFMKKVMYLLPQRVVDFGIWLLEKILYGLNIWSPLINFPKDSFGSVMISNIGFLGVQSAFVPLVPWTRTPLMLSLGKVYERAAVVNGEIMVQKAVDCYWTVDHRLIDGLVGAKMLIAFEKYMTTDLPTLTK
jgi:pyruvate/2-oxoglutarate dehydrogenase complex dihydrolipoamide acyltransferase (E2) component